MFSAHDHFPELVNVICAELYNIPKRVYVGLQMVLCEQIISES